MKGRLFTRRERQQIVWLALLTEDCTADESRWYLDFGVGRLA